MHAVKFPGYRYLVQPLKRLSVLFIIFTISILCNSKVIAQPAHDKKSQPTIKLSTPASVQSVLDKYFELPKTPLVDETAQRAFMRRAQREIGELLATEGYFTPTVILQ